MTSLLDDEYTSRASYARLLVSFADGSSTDRVDALSLSESPTSLTDRIAAMRSPMSKLLSSRTALVTTLVFAGVGLTIGVVACSDAVGPDPTAPKTSAPTESSTAPAFADSSVYMVVEDPPKLVGGMETLQESVEYPEVAKKADIEGRVIVQFVVGPDGAVHDPTVVQGVHELLDQQALEVVKAQEFEPGQQDGEPVPVQMSLPVTFQRSETSAPVSEQSEMAETGDDVYMVVEDRPELVGGMKALQQSVQYPDLARKAGIEGRVIVRFVVDKNGDVKNPQVIRGGHKVLDAAAIDAVKQQEFEPGREKGEPVPVQMSLPVTFKLPDSSASSSSRQSTTEPQVKAATAGLDAFIFDKGSPVIDRETRQRLHGDISYPNLAQKAGIEGKVRVRFTVDDAGQAVNPHIVNEQVGLKNAHDLLAQSALQTVKNVPFTSKDRDDSFSGQEVGVQFQFQLPEEGSYPRSEERLR